MTEQEQFNVSLVEAAGSLGLVLDDAVVARMWAHFERVVETNRQFNLTRITVPAAAAAKLYADSLAPAAWVEDAGVQVHTCLDVGTGGGFPAAPLAIARPDWRVTAIDSTGKKAKFVARCAEEMPIPNLRGIQQRAGENTSRAKYDLIVFKAVGDLAKCLAFAAGSVAPNGHVIVFKGRNLTRQELDAGQARAEEMRMQTWDTVEYDIPLGEETLAHSLVVYKRLV